MPHRANIAGQTFILSTEKVIFWHEMQWLIIADAHFSKETHFRKHGIAIPPNIIQQDMQRVELLIGQYQPKKVVFLGDMFHSDNNPGMDAFAAWRGKQQVEMDLVVGNHDILDRSWYGTNDVQLHPVSLVAENIMLAHDALPEVADDLYLLHGHIHPCIRLTGKAKQVMRLPCYWFAERKGVLPSFGTFTGGHTVLPAKTDMVFAIAGNEVIAIS